MCISIRIYRETRCGGVGCAGGGRTCKHSNTKHAMHTKSAWKLCTARDARILGGLVCSGLDTGKTLKTLEKCKILLKYVLGAL